MANRHDWVITCERMSESQLRRALAEVDARLDGAASDEFAELRWMRRQILIELDARGVKEFHQVVVAMIRQDRRHQEARKRRLPRR
jgi:hypothetical protein